MDAPGRPNPRTLALAAFAAAAILWLTVGAGLDAWRQRAEGRYVRQLSATETAVLALSRRLLEERDLMLEATAATLGGEPARADSIVAALPDTRRRIAGELAALLPAVRERLAVPSIARRLRDRPDAIEALLENLPSDLADLDRARAALAVRLANGASAPARTRAPTKSRTPARTHSASATRTPAPVRGRTASRTAARTSARASAASARTVTLVAAALEASATSERLMGTLYALQRGLCFEPGRAVHRIDGLRRTVAALRDTDAALSERTALGRLASSLDIGSGHETRGEPATGAMTVASPGAAKERVGDGSARVAAPASSETETTAMKAATARAASRVRRARGRLEGLSRERILPPRVSDELRVFAALLRDRQAASNPDDLRALRLRLARLDGLARSRIGTLADDVAARGTLRLAADATLGLLGLWIVGAAGGGRRHRHPLRPDGPLPTPDRRSILRLVPDAVRLAEIAGAGTEPPGHPIVGHGEHSPQPCRSEEAGPLDDRVGLSRRGRACARSPRRPCRRRRSRRTPCR